MTHCSQEGALGLIGHLGLLLRHAERLLGLLPVGDVARDAGHSADLVLLVEERYKDVFVVPRLSLGVGVRVLGP
jgi:hypothetical protein